MTEQPATKEPGLLGTEGSAGGAATTPLMLISGGAADVEVAALVAVLQAHAAAAAAAEPADVPVSRWAAPDRRLRVTHPHGPGGWRASGLPR